MSFLIELCENSDFLSIVKVILNVVDVFCFIVPIVLIVMISINFGKSVIANSEDDMKKSVQIVFKKILSAIAVFLAPMLVHFTMSLLGEIGVDYADCILNATDEKIQVFKQIEQENREQQSQLNQSQNSGNGSTTGSNNSSSQGSSSSNTKVVNFKLSKTSVTLGHYKSTVNSYTIKITDTSGKTLSNSNFNFKSNNSGVVSVSSQGKLVAKFGGKATITVTSKSDSSKSKQLQVVVVNSLYTRVKVSKKVTGTSLISGKKVTLAAGTKGIYNGLARKTSSNAKYINGSFVGDTILVNKDYISLDIKYVKPYQYYITDVYSKSVVEDFINSFGFSSSTKYLFWSNQGTQTNYMFTGSKGKWKLYKTFMINTGDDSLILYSGSAVTGVHFNYAVGSTRRVSGYSYLVIMKAKPNGETNPWHQYGTGKRYPASHGCTRFKEKDIKYLISIHSKIKKSRLIDF